MYMYVSIVHRQRNNFTLHVQGIKLIVLSVDHQHNNHQISTFWHLSNSQVQQTSKKGLHYASNTLAPPMRITNSVCILLIIHIGRAHVLSANVHNWQEYVSRCAHAVRVRDMYSIEV